MPRDSSVYMPSCLRACADLKLRNWEVIYTFSPSLTLPVESQTNHFPLRFDDSNFRYNTTGNNNRPIAWRDVADTNESAAQRLPSHIVI